MSGAMVSPGSAQYMAPGRGEWVCMSIIGIIRSVRAPDRNRYRPRDDNGKCA